MDGQSFGRVAAHVYEQHNAVTLFATVNRTTRKAKPHFAKMTPEEELAELQKKYAALEGDRKAYFETSQWTMKQNKETIGGLKKEYKELLRQITENAKNGVTSAKENEAISHAGSEELYRLQQFSKDLKQRYDHLKQSAVRKTRELENRLDSIRDLEQNSVDPQTLDTDLTKLIRTLENRLDKALIKFNEARSVSQTYEQIIKRLTDERVGFDGQIASLDRSLRQKEKDLDELVLMSHDAAAAKEKAKAELMQVDDLLTKERASRDKDLKDRRDTVRKREEMNIEAARLRKQRDSDEQRRAEQNKKKAEAAKAANANAEAAKNVEQQGKIGNFETAFLKIKDATGVSDLDQVISKFMTQEDTNRNLKQLRKDGTFKIEQLKKEIEKSKSALERFQFGGPVGPASRRAVDDLEMTLSANGVVNDRTRARFETSNKLLVGVTAGTEDLVDKLDTIPFGAATPPVTEATVVQVLAMCEQKILKALERVTQKDGEQKLGKSGKKLGASSKSLDDSLGDTVTPHNFRLALFPDENDESDAEGEDDEEAGEETVMDRDTLKSNAEAMTERATSGRRRGVFTKGNAPVTPGSVKGKAGRGQRAGLA